MAQIFPEWTNKVHIIIAFVIIVAIATGVSFFWYFGSPKYTDVGYRPVQPVEYSHKLHAGDLGMDCRYCHTSVETSAKAIIPPTQTCMNCHSFVKGDGVKITPVTESWGNGTPIEWIRVHKLPDYAFFDHSAHLRAGVGCFSCHGNIDQMEVVKQVEPLSMGWCLDCHRNPDMHLRPLDQITNMNWQAGAGQLEYAKRIKEERNINPPVDCSGCHR